MASEFPFGSSLTAAPRFKLRIHLPLDRYSKYYYALLWLMTFVTFTAGAEDYVEKGKKLRDEFYGFPGKLQKDDTSSSHPTSEDVVLEQRGDAAIIDYTKAFGTTTLSHEQHMIDAIAQEFFFHDTEFNFYDARSWEIFEQWANKTEAGFNEAKSRNQSITVINYFGKKVLGIQNLGCDERGCYNMPTSHFVRQRFSNNRHQARHVLNILRGFEKANSEVTRYPRILSRVEEDLARYCDSFSHVFFHPVTEGKKWMCPAKIVQIVMLVITAIMLIATFVVTAILSPALPILAGGSAATGSAATGSAASGTFAAQLAADAAMLGETMGSVWMNHALSIINLGWEFFGMPYRAGGLLTIWEVPLTPPVLALRRLVRKQDVGIGESNHTIEDDVRDFYNDLIDRTLSPVYPAPVLSADKMTPDVRSGAYGMVEGFVASDLQDRTDGSSVYEQVEVKSGWFFRSYPLAKPWSKPIAHDDAESSSEVKVNRVNRIFDIRQCNPDDTWYTNFPDQLATNIMLRLVNEDKTAMDIGQALDFFEQKNMAINQRWQQLRRKEKEFPSEYPAMVIDPSKFSGAKIKVQESKISTPWARILSNLRFDSAKGIKEHPRFQWKANASSMSKLHKREHGTTLPVESSGHILHDIYGQLDSFEALGILAPPQNKLGKRQSERWAVDHKREGWDDIFNVNITAQYFRNEIHVEQCGIDHYKDSTRKNEAACRKFLADIVGQVTHRMNTTFATANEEPRAMTNYLKKRFATYTTWTNVDLLREKEEPIRNKLFQNMKNSLVSKAYSNGNCFVRCAKTMEMLDTAFPNGPVDLGEAKCQAVCYDPIKDRNEALYGFNPDDATKFPWSLSQKKIIETAWYAYGNRSEFGYLPGSVIVNPYVPLTHDESPILPVCYSALEIPYTDALPCSCGDEFGSETREFARSVNLRALGKKAEYAALRSCLDRTKHLAYTDPAKFLINACRYFFEVVVPPGTGSYQEKKNKGHYKENLQACERYKPQARTSKLELCSAWARHSKDHHRGPDHSKVDFSYVNNIMDDIGCKGYR